MTKEVYRSLDVKRQQSDHEQNRRTSSLGDIWEWGGAGVEWSKAGVDDIGQIQVIGGGANDEN